MTASLTDILCTACGLCCDGTLFADVELGGKDDLDAFEVLGLEIEDADEDHGGLLLLPCRALEGTRCSIYAHRPECCRTFECRLLQEAMRGVVDVAQAAATIAITLGRVAHVRSLVAALDPSGEPLSLRERCVDALALSAETNAGIEAQRTREELESAVDKLESIIRESFLDNPH